MKLYIDRLDTKNSIQVKTNLTTSNFDNVTIFARSVAFFCGHFYELNARKYPMNAIVSVQMH